jgi:tetratricopeptide (TPR) repeat protein
MRRVVLLTALIVAVTPFAAAQKKNQPAPPAPAAAPTPLPGTKLLPQAKTDVELKAYKDTADLKEPAALEAAADSFAQKFPDSELRYPLYDRAMFAYQGQNNAEKAIEMGRKVLALNPNEPSTLAIVAEMISERIGEPGESLDRDERLKEAQQDAEKALQTVDTDLRAEPTTPLAQLDQSKRLIRSTAYSALGITQLGEKNYAAAENNFKQSIDALPESPDGVTVLRYAVTLDQQHKYAEALTAAERAMQLAPAGSPQAAMAKQERDRIVLLKARSAAGGGASTPASAPPPAAPSSK